MPKCEITIKLSHEKYEEEEFAEVLRRLAKHIEYIGITTTSVLSRPGEVIGSMVVTETK